MAAAGAFPREIKVQYGAEACGLLLFEGADSAALNFTLNSRFGLAGAPFHLTALGSAALVPLSAALPAGLVLELHTGVVGSPPLAQSVLPTPSQLGHVPSSPWHRPSMMRLVSRRSEGKPEEHRVSFREQADVDMEAPAPVEVQSSTLSVEAAGSMVQEATMALAQIEKTTMIMDRFSRLSTDLANERTLLAWMRTCMAAMRTAFAYLALTSEEPFWMVSIHISRSAMMLLVAVAAVTGIVRYHMVKKATFLPSPPHRFGRLSIVWFNGLVVSCIVITMLGIMMNTWKKG